jgi:hypothetical protein
VQHRCEAAAIAREVAVASTVSPETIRLQEAEFDAEQRRVADFVEFVAEGRGSRALADALTASEKRLEDFHVDLDGLRRSRHEVFSAPPERVACRADGDDADGSRTPDSPVGAAAEKAARTDQAGAGHAGHRAPVLPGPVRPRRQGTPSPARRWLLTAMAQTSRAAPWPRSHVDTPADR